jgi:hypothetical protein
MFRLQHSCRGSVKKIIKVGGENRTDWNWCKLKDRNSATQWPKREMCIKLCQFLCLPLFSDPGQHKELYLLVALTTHVILRSVGSTLVKKNIRLQALLISLPERRQQIVYHRHQKLNWKEIDKDVHVDVTDTSFDASANVCSSVLTIFSTPEQENDLLQRLNPL